MQEKAEKDFKTARNLLQEALTLMSAVELAPDAAKQIIPAMKSRMQMALNTYLSVQQSNMRAIHYAREQSPPPNILRELTEALSFYAVNGNYSQREDGSTAVGNDLGIKAKEALKQFDSWKAHKRDRDLVFEEQLEDLIDNAYN